MTLNPGLPLEQECYILLTFPDDLEYEFTKLEGDGIFLGPSGNYEIPTSERILQKDDVTGKLSGILFSGCEDESSLSEG